MSSSLSTGKCQSADLDQYFKQTQTTALHMIEHEDYAQALEQLGLNERVLEEAKEQDCALDPDFVLVTLHNSACCHQALGRLEDSASYLEACLYNLKHVLKARESGKKGDNERFKLRKYESRARLQLCAMLSQLGRHEAALSHAQIGLRLAQALLLDVSSLCRAHLTRHRKLLLQAKQTPDLLKRLESPAYKRNQDLVRKASPLLEVLESRILSKPRPTGQPVTKLELRSALGVQHYSDWIYTYNMTELMRVQPLTLYELKNCLDTYTEIGRDMMLDKACLLVAGYFCTATELRLLLGDEDRGRLKEAQTLHSKALQIARDALPLEAPLLGHVQVSYQKHFAGVELNRTSRLGKLDTSARAKLLLSATAKPRSSSAKATRNPPRPVKPRSPAPVSSRLKRKVPDKPAPAPFTDRGTSDRSPSRKSATPIRLTKRTEVETWASDSSEEYILCSSDLYGPEDIHPRTSRHIECSVDIRDLDDRATLNNDYVGTASRHEVS